LLEKYWQAQTDEAEEAELKAYFAGRPAPGDHPASPLFDYFREEKQIVAPVGLDKRFESVVVGRPARGNWLLPVLQIAAVLLIAFSIIWVLLPASKPVSIAFKETDTYDDPEKAYLETKKALLLISHHLNAGERYMKQIGNLNKAEEPINTKANRK